MRLVVTGGAGYIGSHAVERLCDDGHDVLVLDNLVTGHRPAVDRRATLEVLDLRQYEAVERALCDHQPTAVLHFAALSIVSESVREPLRYWDNNVGGALSLLRAMGSAGVESLVFSSTCSTYGVPEIVPITEQTPQRPINTYGHTKLTVERLISDYAANRPTFSYATLRYFNVAGCGGGGRLGEDHRPETHLLPLVIRAATGQREDVAIYGTDYPTPDGTCVRDYLHVDDLVDAHVRALERLRPGDHWTLNLGTETGTSVRAIVEAVERVTGRTLQVRETTRRPGDVPVLRANAQAAQETLGWSPSRSDIDTIVASAWRWHQAFPTGYDD